MANREVSLGVYNFEKSTRNTHRYRRDLDGGRYDVQYVQKTVVGENPPAKLELIARVSD